MAGRGPDRDAVIYQNIELATGESLNLAQTFTVGDGVAFTGQLADHNVQRGAAILDDAERYWVSVQEACCYGPVADVDRPVGYTS